MITFLWKFSSLFCRIFARVHAHINIVGDETRQRENGKLLCRYIGEYKFSFVFRVVAYDTASGTFVA